MTSVSEDGLVFNLWLTRSKIFYLAVDFLHVHSINTCITEREAWTSQGSCKPSCIQVAEFSINFSAGSKAPFLGGWFRQGKTTWKKKQGMSKRGNSPAAGIPDTIHGSCWVRRALAMGTFLSSLLWQTEKLRSARGTFSRNSNSRYKGKSLRSPSWVVPTEEFGSCLLQNFRGCWGWWWWISASTSPPLLWSVSSNHVSLNLTLLPCVASRKIPSTQFSDQQNSFWTSKPWSSPECSSYRMQCFREHSAHQSKASMSWPSSEGNISLIFLQWLQHHPGTRRDKLNQGTS